MAAVSFNTNNQTQNLHNNPTNSNLFDRVGQFAKKIFNGIKDYIEKAAIVLIRIPIINKLASRIPSEFLTNNLNFQIHLNQTQLRQNHDWDGDDNPLLIRRIS